MPSDLWSFTLDFYARPNVEQACITLQASGANVCMLLCGVWLDRQGVPFEKQRAQEIRQLAIPWDDQVVKPLRELRTCWKAKSVTDSELGTLRERVKALELDAEHELLVRLERLARDWHERGARRTDAWLEALAGHAANVHPDALHILRRVGKELA
jgi:uncharacterized protein (TIGR02444 family)